MSAIKHSQDNEVELIFSTVLTFTNNELPHAVGILCMDQKIACIKAFYNF